MRAGDELPALTIPVTRTLVVAGAIASRDYQDVHHDVEAARAKGSPDIFMNILTTNGLVGRYITDYFGPEATLLKVSIRLGVPNYPGDVLTLTGRIVSVSDHAHDSHGVPVEAEVAVRGANGLGRHVTGTVIVTVPGPTPAPDSATAG
ncbi:MaoC/PaaZ C-terminal domain-containing protein [Streptomyces sp. ISL-11]|uniref:MaoC/PaaZ C-terminal domain-containing protein n=1 Tax=Streptomyces sp. ISL-11 TaxID=2819174 RepID=UPI001BEBF427|nr:MaoC/PaaZ C-terminal domain-containing protein [Streptomyces sp. ISL-11]MBT2384445.1 acyl dehydratase [Streptomyces sp. ISL-11]